MLATQNVREEFVGTPKPSDLLRDIGPTLPDQLDPASPVALSQIGDLRQRHARALTNLNQPRAGHDVLVVSAMAGWRPARDKDAHILPMPQTDVLVSVKPLRQIPKQVPTAFVVEGRGKPKRIASAMTSFVVTHPQARFLVDPAICVDVAERALAQLPKVLLAAANPPHGVVSTVEALREENGPAVDFALPTHLHWDHVCGLLDLPRLPVHLHRLHAIRHRVAVVPTHDHEASERLRLTIP